jgi:hypothetical protein
LFDLILVEDASGLFWWVVKGVGFCEPKRLVSGLDFEYVVGVKATLWVFGPEALRNEFISLGLGKGLEPTGIEFLPRFLGFAGVLTLFPTHLVNNIVSGKYE